ncbi:GGDEF domain-containing protein [Paludibacterium yongneupense]|uniref:GGDEF domain-containing protein n=1 Tax=Paludibacterium yongneupense TaxID=400061 RepID=UPI00048E10E0|nr:GGDEF domain-containing protein [Paludibacterium yongneupense]
MTTNNPIEVARETLKQLTQRKLLPTPENFESVYHELTHTPLERENRLARQILRALEVFPASTVPAKVTQSRLQQVIAEERWEQVPQLVIDYARLTADGNGLTEPWGGLIQNLIRCWDLRQADLPQHFKHSALERVLINYGNQPDELNLKLSALVQNWSLPPGQRIDAASCTMAEADDIPASTGIALPAAAGDDCWETWRRTLSFAIKHGLEPRLVHFPELVSGLESLLAELEGLSDDKALDGYLPRLRSFIVKIELQAHHEERLVSSLASLLSLMLENIAEVNRSDSYLVGQVSTLQDVLAHQPLSMQQVYMLESSLKEVIRKQGLLRSSLDEAASSLRALLDRFITRLALMTDSTDVYHAKISRHGKRLQQTRDVEELGTIIGELLDDTSQMQIGLTQSHDELVSARTQVEAAEQRIQELENALETASAKVKEDQLTGAYNRRGLAEFLQREIARSERNGSPLCVALIDVDNFKQLNDRYGHLAGDDALRYLVDVIRGNIRPADVVARFGGEEFVLLMPETSEAEAVDTVRRLQRELTKTFFLANNDRLVITFSAGVARWHLGEVDTDVLERADRAMYQAKLAGKNRVTSAEEGLAL